MLSNSKIVHTYDLKEVNPATRDFRFALVVAGEASGDLHGSNLIKSIKGLDPSIRVWGIGGQKMEEQGVRILIPSSDMAVVGLTEVIPRLKTILRANRTLKYILRTVHPDLLILIDYPEFNLHLAGVAKTLGIPVLYYVSPQIWAWRKGRVKKIARRVDRMAVILPFEEDFYKKRGVNVHYVGNPLMDEFNACIDKKDHPSEFDADSPYPVVGLLPGSRKEEIDRLLPDMLRAAERLKSHFGGLTCILPLAPTIEHKYARTLTENSPLDVAILRGDIYELLDRCDIAVVTSGTATLQTAISLTPMVIVYKVSPVTYWAGRMIIDVPHIGLVNLVAGHEVAPELIQDQVQPENIASELIGILEDEERREKIKRELQDVKDRLGSGGASLKTARIALDLMKV